MRTLDRRLAMRSIAMFFPSLATAAKVVAEEIDLNKITVPLSTASVGESAPGEKFTDFSTWLSEAGDECLKREARYIRAFDADIVAMRLPLVTKARMQRKRNYQTALADSRKRFYKAIGVNGFFQWWG